MDCRISRLIIISLVFVAGAKADGDRTVFFIDSSGNRYIRPASSDDVVEFLESLRGKYVLEWGICKFKPLGAKNANYFDDSISFCCCIYLAWVCTTFYTFCCYLISDPKLFFNQDNAVLSGALCRKIKRGAEKPDFQFSDEDKVPIVFLDEPLANYADNDISKFVSWMGGSYIADVSKPLNGELIIPLANGVSLNLHIAENAVREFISSSLRLIYNLRRSINIHEDLSKSVQVPAELIAGYFDGLKDLQETYGSEEITHQGATLFFATLSKIFNLLQEAYEGEIVGVIIFSGTSQLDLDKILHPMFSPRPNPRWLVESESSKDSSVAEVILVRQTIAWVTGIILFITTLIAVYFLMSMPLTKDTLLYSNVKLD